MCQRRKPRKTRRRAIAPSNAAKGIVNVHVLKQIGHVPTGNDAMAIDRHLIDRHLNAGKGNVAKETDPLDRRAMVIGRQLVVKVDATALFHHLHVRAIGIQNEIRRRVEILVLFHQNSCV